MNDLQACLPASLQSARVERVKAGLSGAGVYEVQSEGERFILKVARPDEDEQDWLHRVQVLRQVGAAGLAPAVVHVDRARRAVLSEFVQDRSFMRFYVEQTGEALTLLGEALRRLHALPVDSAYPRSREPRRVLHSLWSGALQGFAVPDWVRQTVEAVGREDPPHELTAVLSHNDVNPTNLVYDGRRVLILDWDTAGANDRYYDPASFAVFTQMDDAECLQLLSAYEGTTMDLLPTGFDWNRRLVATLAGSIFLRLARESGHSGDSQQERTSLQAFYGDLQSGRVTIAEPTGQWRFGIGLLSSAL